MIGQGMEKYLTISVGKHLVFKDSIQFLGSALHTLADNLAKGGLEKFKNLIEHCEGIPDHMLKLLVRKGVYPYEYMDSMERFEEKQLPPKEVFFSKLTNSDISDEDYQHAQNVWKTFKIKDMLQYHNLYLMSIKNKLDICINLTFNHAHDLVCYIHVIHSH